MWAIIDRSSKQVLSILEPMATQEEIDKVLEKDDLVLMTLDNSPAYIYGYYIDGKFTNPALDARKE